MSAAYIVSRRDIAMQELHTKSWLQQLPADLRKTLLALTCTPADILLLRKATGSSNMLALTCLMEVVLPLQLKSTNACTGFTLVGRTTDRTGDWS